MYTILESFHLVYRLKRVVFSHSMFQRLPNTCLHYFLFSKYWAVLLKNYCGNQALILLNAHHSYLTCKVASVQLDPGCEHDVLCWYRTFDVLCWYHALYKELVNRTMQCFIPGSATTDIHSIHNWGHGTKRSLSHLRFRNRLYQVANVAKVTYCQNSNLHFSASDWVE